MAVVLRSDWLSLTTHWDRTSQEAGIGSSRHTINSKASCQERRVQRSEQEHGHEASELKLLLGDDQPSVQVGIEQQKEEQEGGGDRKEHETSSFYAVKCRCQGRYCEAFCTWKHLLMGDTLVWWFMCASHMPFSTTHALTNTHVRAHFPLFLSLSTPSLASFYPLSLSHSFSL